MAGAELRIEVVYSPAAGQVELVSLRLPQGARLLDALHASGLCSRHGLDVATLRAGIWGRVQPLHTLLRERDRVELYRALRVEPKQARRLRQQRARQASAKSAAGR